MNNSTLAILLGLLLGGGSGNDDPACNTTTTLALCLCILCMGCPSDNSCGGTGFGTCGSI